MIRRCNLNGDLKNYPYGNFVLDCIGLTVIVLMQEGKQQGLGSIAGVADTYWEETKDVLWRVGLVKATTVMAILFFVLAVILNMNF